MLQKILPAADAIHYRPDLSRPYTLESVELVEQEYPQVPLWLVIGSDLLSQVHQWHQAPILAQKVELLVFPPSYPTRFSSGKFSLASSFLRTP
jgi:nicotinic acid mononucleotide adenylyltransferase